MGESDQNDFTSGISVDELLKDVKSSKDASSKIIIENDGRGLYHHFAYPVGGLRTKDDAETRSRRRASTANSKVPDVLPIQLPSGNQMPLDAASPSPRRKTILNDNDKTDIPPMPDLSAPTLQANAQG